nr:unnamed protein product [Spirometra erinaceieuropaei]
MLYFEDFMEAIESLPAEVNETLTNLRDIDCRLLATLEPVSGLINTLFENCKLSRLSNKEKEIEYERILNLYDQALAHSSKKTEIVRNLYELYRKVVRKLDAELGKFRLELEADNSGVTSKIEHRIHTLLGRNSSAVNRLDKRRTKLRSGHLFNNSRVISRRRQPYSADVPERPFFVLKRRFAAFETPLASLPPVPSYSNSGMPFLPMDSSGTLMSDEQNRPPGSDSLRRIPSSGSLDSMDRSITDFDTFQPDSQEFCDPGDDLHVPIDSNKRSRTLGTPQKPGNSSDVPGRDSHRLLHGYEPGCSPFVSSDNEAISMTNISNNLSYPINDQSVDDLLVEPRHPRDPLYTPRDKTTPRSGGSPEPSVLQQQASSRPGLPKLVARRTGAGESPRHSWFPSSSAAVSGEPGRLHSTGSQSSHGTIGREKRASRTSRRPSRLGSQTDSNDESSDHDLMTRPAYSAEAHSKPPVAASGSQQEGDYRKSLHGSPRISAVKRETMHSVATENKEDQRRYCFCHDVSYGDMIACDAPNCPFEWFHYNCVGLVVAPKGEWFCPSCSKLSSTARFGRKRTNKR